MGHVTCEGSIVIPQRTSHVTPPVSTLVYGFEEERWQLVKRQPAQALEKKHPVV